MRISLATGIALSVHNPGAVPERIRESFFHKYATFDKPGGWGLGAYSARLMSRVQGGELAMATSAAEGTTLTLSLPAAQPAQAPAAAPARPAAQERGGALPALRVLVVDDDEFNILFMRANLPSPPLAVDSAVNGRAALQAARAQRYDAVFMDLEMPVMDGFEALAGLRRIEAEEGRGRASVIAFSSFDDEATRARCAQAGFDGYLTKPAPLERIHELLRGAVGAAVDPELEAHLPAFLESRRALVDELARALGDGDRGEARRIAHKLAGSLSLYGFRWAAGEARAIHGEAQAGELAALSRRCARLRRHLETTRHGQQEDAAAG